MGGGYFSAEMQSLYFTALADWAIKIGGKCQRRSSTDDHLVNNNLFSGLYTDVLWVSSWCNG